MQAGMFGRISRRRSKRAFTLVELVMVVTIIGIVAAIAVPRISSSSSRASGAALQATLLNVRTAIDCYYAEHNKYPGYNPITSAPNGNEFINQLTMYSDAAGVTNATRSATFKYGPYLRPPFPKNPANDLQTVHVKPASNSPNPADGSVGWVAVLSTGDFGVSATDTQLDEIGVLAAEEKAIVKVRPSF